MFASLSSLSPTLNLVWSYLFNGCAPRQFVGAVTLCKCQDLPNGCNNVFRALNYSKILGKHDDTQTCSLTSLKPTAHGSGCLVKNTQFSPTRVIFDMFTHSASRHDTARMCTSALTLLLHNHPVGYKYKLLLLLWYQHDTIRPSDYCPYPV